MVSISEAMAGETDDDDGKIGSEKVKFEQVGSELKTENIQSHEQSPRLLRSSSPGPGGLY